LLYGATKIGKTTFASEAPGVLFLATEPGTNALEVYSQPIHSWPELCSALAELAQPGHPFQTVCIDTIDNAYNFCSEYICGQLGIKGPEELGHGKAYGPINREFKRVLLKLANLPIGLLCISHSKQKEIEERTGKYMKTVPTLPNKPGEIVVGLMDMVLLAEMEATKDDDGKVTEWRVIRTKPSVNHDAGDRTGRLPEVLPLNYQAFIDAFESNSNNDDKE
jgi:hypothetical protein